jgi:hypothetical protein
MQKLKPYLSADRALNLQYQHAQFSRKYGSNDNGDANGSSAKLHQKK